MSPKTYKAAAANCEVTNSNTAWQKSSASGFISGAWRLFFKKAYAFTLVVAAVVLSFMVQILIPLYAIFYFS